MRPARSEPRGEFAYRRYSKPKAEETAPTSHIGRDEALVLENLALRHQLLMLRRRGQRPDVLDRDRWLWIALSRFWKPWRSALVVLQPETVVRWHRRGFRAYWAFKSRPRGGRPRLDPDVRRLIRHMWSANPTWGKRRIQAELAKLGIAVSDSTVRRYRPARPRPPSAS